MRENFEENIVTMLHCFQNTAGVPRLLLLVVTVYLLVIMTSKCRCDSKDSSRPAGASMFSQVKACPIFPTTEGGGQTSKIREGGHHTSETVC